MIVSHEWLKQFVPHNLSAAELGELLSRHVVTLDGLRALRADLATFVVGRVVESEKIPETKLSYNKVDDGSGTLLDVVCGAPNVVVGTLYPFARTGTVMPGGMVIEKRKIRGFTSNGMLCSARELGLGQDHDGILALDVDVPPGTPLLTAMPIGDSVLDLDVLPNRPDLLSHLGIAREISALTGVALQQPTEIGSCTVPKATTGAGHVTAAGATITVQDTDGCPRYVGVLIRGVKVGPSPEWLAARVTAMGGRSINNVVDATNYVLHGLGQPVHAFDFAKLRGGAIVVRKANAGETLVTLDGVERKLEPWMTIIADGERATALAGVMGGKESEVTDATTEILLEVALFAPKDVRKVRRAVGLSTDASYRFERGVDRISTLAIAERAAALITSVAGGTVDAMLDVASVSPPPLVVELRPARVEKLLGAPVPDEEIKRLLTAIGFKVEVSANRTFKVTVPAFRHDVTLEADLVEEIARLRGYDVLPDTLSPYRPGTVADHPLHLAGRRVRDALVGAGLAEVRPMPFTKGNDSEDFARVTNPLADDEPFLRRTLLDTLARRAEYNLNRQQGNVRLFEVGSAFAPVKGALPIEEVRVAALIMGDRRPSHFTEPKPPKFDAWDAKALAEQIARAAFPGRAVSLLPSEQDSLWFVRVDDEAVGSVSAVKLDAPIWAAPAFGVEITLGVMGSARVAAPRTHAHHATRVDEARTFVQFKSLPTTPAAEFDLALLVPNDLPAAEVERVITAAGGELLERVALFDEFRGAGVPEGMRSLAWRLTFRHPERTLRDKEIDGRRSQLLKTLESQLGVVPRTA
jgi:phenylalanyl-tRNA synthetase beta chain